LFIGLSITALYAAVMTRRKQPPKDLTGIRQRVGTYQIRISAGYDPVTGRQLMLSGSADTEDSAIVIRDRLRQQVRDDTAARTNVTFSYLLDTWLPAHQIEEGTRASYQLLIERFIRPSLGDTSLSRLCRLGARPFEQLYAELRVCRRRCHGRAFVEHRTSRPHDCDDRCASHVCTPLAPVHCAPVSRSAQRRSQRRETVGLDHRQSARRRLAATHPDTATAPPFGRGSSQDRDCSLGARRRLGHLRLAHLRHRGAAQ
jgi:hypothetical protein